MTIDELLTRGSDADFRLVEDMLLSEQIDEKRVASLLASHPEFAKWLVERDKQRKAKP
jgi:hypothetical protein